MTTATLDHPATPARPAAPPAPMRWQTNNDGVQVGRDVGDRAIARCSFHAEHALAGLDAATRQTVAALILTPLRERVAALPAVRRYGVLRRELAAVEDDLRGVEVSLRRATGERAETLHHARPGFAQRLADLDAEIADLGRRKAEIDGRLAALAGPVADAKRLAERDAEDARVGIHGEAAHALHGRRMDLAGRLGPLVGQVLTELLVTTDALHGCTSGIACHGQEVVRDVARIADEAAAGE